MKLLKTKKARDLAVKGLAQGIMVKDCVIENAMNIREEAEDICNEAKAVAKETCDCECGCDEASEK